jgi:trigger factor
VGSGRQPEELNAALTGLSPGETRQARVTYPEEGSPPSLAGKTLDYTLALKAIKHKVLPEADDEFAKDLGDHDTLAQLRDGLRERLLAAERRRIDRETKDALVEALVARAGFEVPEALVERHMNSRTEGAARSLALQGIDPTRTEIDWRRYRESQREDAVKAAKADILLDEIARRESVAVSEAELDAEIESLAQRLKKSKEALRLQMDKDGDLDALRARIREEKTLDLLKANARLSLE